MKPFTLVCALSHILQSAGVCAPVPLIISPGGAFDVNYQLSSGQSTSPIKLLITGNFIGDVEVSGGVISKFRFLGGDIAYSDNTSEAILSTFPVVAKVRIETRNVVSALTSNDSAGTIDPFTGVISNSGHFLQQNRGTIFTRYIVAGITVQQELRDLATRPDTNPLVGVTTVTSTLLQDLGYKARYRIDFNHTRDEDRTEPADVINGTVNITEKGSFNATGEVTIPGQAFADWALAERGQVPASLGDRHAATGQPLGLLYAFGATIGPWTPPVLHLPIREGESTGPESGTRWLLTENPGSSAIQNPGDSSIVVSPRNTTARIKSCIGSSVVTP